MRFKQNFHSNYWIVGYHKGCKRSCASLTFRTAVQCNANKKIKYFSPLDFFDRKHSQNSSSYYIPNVVSTQIPFTFVLSPRISYFCIHYISRKLLYYFYILYKSIFDILFVTLIIFNSYLLNFSFLIKFQIPFPVVPVILFAAYN